jgi:hypothetical protein
VGSFLPEKGRLFSPPLAVWLIVAALSAALFLLSLTAFSRYSVSDRAYYEASVSRLASFRVRENGGKKPLRVIAIGSSGMGKAVFIDKDMEALARKQGLDGLEFMRLTCPACGIMDFMPLLNGICGAAPDVILVESYSALYDRHRVRNAFARKYTDFLRATLMGSLKAERFVFPELEKPHTEEEFERPLLDGRTAPSLDALILHWKEKSPIGIEESGPFFSEAAKRGIRVVLVGIPRHPEFERRAGGPGPETIELRRRLEEDYGVESISFPREIGARSYSDFVHLNEEGRLEFSLWLIEELKGASGRI